MADPPPLTGLKVLELAGLAPGRWSYKCSLSDPPAVFRISPSSPWFLSSLVSRFLSLVSCFLSLVSRLSSLSSLLPLSPPSTPPNHSHLQLPLPASSLPMPVLTSSASTVPSPAILHRHHHPRLFPRTFSPGTRLPSPSTSRTPGASPSCAPSPGTPTS